MTLPFLVILTIHPLSLTRETRSTTDGVDEVPLPEPDEQQLRLMTQNQYLSLMSYCSS